MNIENNHEGVSKLSKKKGSSLKLIFVKPRRILYQIIEKFSNTITDCLEKGMQVERTPEKSKIYSSFQEGSD